MTFKTLTSAQAAHLASLPLDYEWDNVIANGFIAASDETNPRLAEALEALNIHGAADLYLGAAERIVARVQHHMPVEDSLLRLQSAWAATVDPRYSTLAGAAPSKVAPDDAWTLPEWRVRRAIGGVVESLEEGATSTVRRFALGTILMAEHVCGRDPAFNAWLIEALKAKAQSSPRRADDLDYTFQDTQPATPAELVAPSREERLEGLNPAAHPYLRSAAEMSALGFTGEPYRV